MSEHAGVGYGALGAGLEGRGVIVTGAARGVGAATARAMAAAGARVAAVDINAAGLAEVVAGLDGTGHRAITFDLRDAEAIDDLVAGSSRSSATCGRSRTWQLCCGARTSTT